MRIVKTIIQYILATILALSVLTLVLINIVSSKILNRNYVLDKLDEENYYQQIYEDIKSNFENYIYQSGLDEEVLNDIVTKDKIEKDTKIIISNIYDGLNEEIETEEIKNNLNQNIKNYLGGNISSTDQKSIDTFVDTICQEYKTTILHTNYEGKINHVYQTITKYTSITQKLLLIVIVVCLILMALLTIRRIYRILAKIGTAFTIDGLILVIGNKYINTKIKINTITILNNSVSEILRNILKDILNNIMIYGIISLVLGIVLIVIYAIIKSIRKINREKEQYTPEN